MRETIEFLKKHNIKNYEIIDDKLVIKNDILIENLESIPNGILNNCIINGHIILDDLKVSPKDFLNNSIIKYNIKLNQLRTISSNCFNNCTIYGFLDLYRVEYLPKGFKPNVKKGIWLTSLKSKMLKDLLYLPGPSRKLGFNLLNNI